MDGVGGEGTFINYDTKVNVPNLKFTTYPTDEIAILRHLQLIQASQIPAVRRSPATGMELIPLLLNSLAT